MEGERERWSLLSSPFPILKEETKAGHCPNDLEKNMLKTIIIIKSVSGFFELTDPDNSHWHNSLMFSFVIGRLSSTIEL